MEKIIKARVKSIVEEAKADLEETMERKQKKLDAYLECLEATSKIVLPVNLLGILTEGGYVDLFVLDDENHEDHIEIRCGNASHYLNIKRDIKYRVLTIVERIQPKSVNRGGKE